MKPGVHAVHSPERDAPTPSPGEHSTQACLLNPISIPRGNMMEHVVLHKYYEASGAGSPHSVPRALIVSCNIRNGQRGTAAGGDYSRAPAGALHPMRAAAELPRDLPLRLPGLLPLQGPAVFEVQPRAGDGRGVLPPAADCSGHQQHKAPDLPVQLLRKLGSRECKL
jgi:hypothetical protein